MANALSYEIDFVACNQLRATEKHDPQKVIALTREISQVGVWRSALLVEPTLMAVLDGHHRLAAALRLKLARIPIVKVEYGDPRLRLTSRRREVVVSPEAVLEAAISGRLFEPKTTRHQMDPPLPVLNIDLQELM